MRVQLTRIEKLVGAFLSLCLALLLVWMIASAHQSLRRMFDTGLVLYVVADDAQGVLVGSPVRMFDMDVGSVTHVELLRSKDFPGKRVRMRLQIQSQASEYLGAQTKVVTGAGLPPPVGPGGVELRPSGEGSLKSGSYLVAETVPSLFSMVTRDADAMKDDARGVMTEVAVILKNIRKVTDHIADGKGAVGKVVFTEQLTDDVQSLLKDAQKIAGEVDVLVGSANRIAASAPVLIQDAHGLTSDGKKALERVNAILDTVPVLVELVKRALDDASALMAELKSVTGYAPELARKVDTSLEETQRLIEAVQKNILIRGSLPERPKPRTEAMGRPAAGAASVAAPPSVSATSGAKGP